MSAVTDRVVVVGVDGSDASLDVMAVALIGSNDEADA